LINNFILFLFLKQANKQKQLQQQTRKIQINVH